MAVAKFYNANLYFGGYALATDHSMVKVTEGAEELDATVFQQTTRKHIGGLYTVDLAGEYLQQYGAGQVEAILQTHLNASVVYVVTPDTATVGDRAFLGTALMSALSPMGGTVGELHKGAWSSKASNGQPCVRGQMFKAAGAVTANSASTMVQLGALSSSQRMYAAIHVLSASGTSPTLDVIVRSDDNVTPTSPTTRITLTQATGITSQLSSVAGAITDDYWGITWTIGGSSTPTFSFVVALGIL